MSQKLFSGLDKTIKFQDVFEIKFTSSVIYIDKKTSVCLQEPRHTIQFEIFFALSPTPFYQKKRYPPSERRGEFELIIVVHFNVKI